VSPDDQAELVRSLYQIEAALHDLETGIKALKHADEISIERAEFVGFMATALQGCHATLVCRWEAAFALVRRENAP